MGADLERLPTNHLPYESVAPKRCKHIYFSELDSVQEFSLQEIYLFLSINQIMCVLLVWV